jgi:hypothetical protein
VGPIFVVAVVFRLALALVNRWANDPHMEVVYRILNNPGFPKARECWECHHPKLFYLCTAALVHGFSLPREGPTILAAQLLNVTLSIIALFLFARFLSGLTLSPLVRNLVFATVACNPGWWAISAEATNDSMVITLSLVAFLASYRFFTHPSGGRLLLCALFCALAAVSKASGVVVTLLCAFNVGIALLSERKRAAAKVLWSPWLLGALLLVAPVPILGGYVQNHRITGDAFTLTLPQYPLPSLFDETPYARPGIESIASGYFTFRIADMVAHPYTGNRDEPSPRHRTSMWSQLYGRLFFTRFDSWPPEWETRDERILSVGRVALVAALATPVVFWLGWASSIANLWRRRRTLFSQAIGEREFLQISGMASTGVFLLSLIRVTALYRDFSAMKFIYLMPIICGFAAIYMEGWQVLQARHRRLLPILTAMVSLLIVTHFVDMSWLIVDLVRIRRL